MKLNKQEFKKLPLEDKIAHIVEHNKNKLIKKGKIDNFIYLIDSKGALHVVPVDNKKYLNDRDYREIFRDILKGIINDYAYKKIIINNLFYISEAYFNPSFKNLQNINLDVTFANYNANESLLVYTEDKINMSLEVYDSISIYESGKRFTILSNDPIKSLEYCKLDPDDNLKGALTNILR